jgi:hypothetical protein
MRPLAGRRFGLMSCFNQHLPRLILCLWFHTPLISPNIHFKKSNSVPKESCLCRCCGIRIFKAILLHTGVWIFAGFMYIPSFSGYRYCYRENLPFDDNLRQANIPNVELARAWFVYIVISVGQIVHVKSLSSKLSKWPSLVFTCMARHCEIWRDMDSIVQ